MKKSIITLLVFVLPFYAFTFEIGIVFNGPLHVRQKNSINSEQISVLQTFETVEIIKKSDKPENISGLNEYWYQIKTYGNITGWVFGGYLSVITISDFEVKTLFDNSTKVYMFDFLDRYDFPENKIREYMRNKTLSESYYQQTGNYKSIKMLDDNFHELILDEESNIFMILYQKKGDLDYLITDIKKIKKVNNTSYLTSGPVKLNDETWDWNVYVLVNGPFEKGINKSITAAFKSDTENGKIKSVRYSSIALYSEE